MSKKLIDKILEICKNDSKPIDVHNVYGMMTKEQREKVTKRIIELTINEISKGKKFTYDLFTVSIFVFCTAFGMIAAELVRVTFHNWLLFGMVVFGWLTLVMNWLLSEMKKEDIREEIRNGRR